MKPPLKSRHPRISLIPKMDRGRVIKNEREFHCTFYNCRFKSSRWFQIDKHIIQVHTCKTCLQLFTFLKQHKRKQIIVGAGSSSATQTLSPPNIDLGNFVITRSAHMGIISILYQQFNIKPATTFEPLFEKALSDIQRITTGYLNHFRGIKLAIYVDTVMEHIDTSIQRKRRFYSPHTSYLHESAITGTIYSIYNYILTGITLNQRD
jgi:hypothetical protein